MASICSVFFAPFDILAIFVHLIQSYAYCGCWNWVVRFGMGDGTTFARFWIFFGIWFVGVRFCDAWVVFVYCGCGFYRITFFGFVWWIWPPLCDLLLFLLLFYFLLGVLDGLDMLCIILLPSLVNVLFCPFLKDLGFAWWIWPALCLLFHFLFVLGCRFITWLDDKWLWTAYMHLIYVYLAKIDYRQWWQLYKLVVWLIMIFHCWLVWISIWFIQIVFGPPMDTCMLCWFVISWMPKSFVSCTFTIKFFLITLVTFH